MIEINLLPPEMKKRELPFANVKLSDLSLQKLPVFNIVLVISAGVVALQIVLFMIGMAGTIRLNALTKKYASLLPAKNEVEALKLRVDDINKRSAAIDELMSRRFGWAKKMNSLSDSVTQGIWLAELSYDEKPQLRGAAPKPAAAQGKPQFVGLKMPGSLVMTGYAAAAGEQGAALVGKFIKSLKYNGEFYDDFSDIELVSTKSDKVANQDVMNFRIICYFK